MSQLIALVGPTAVGKTDVSIALATQLDAEIVGCDSMQVYRRMGLLTQQPTPEQRAEVPHHLIDVIEPTDSFSVGEYRRLALERIEDIHARGKSVLLVGGTGLYLKALTNGLSELPSADHRIREGLAAAAQAEGSPVLHARLEQVDRPAAAKIHPHDTRRIVRALEVYELTGRPLSSFWRWDGGADEAVTVIGLTREREELDERINRRVERMIREEGVLAEARDVLTLELSRTARQVHGLRFLAAYLNGTHSLDEIIPLWQRQVRQYARRQLVWFRAMPGIRWVGWAAGESVESVVRRIVGSDPPLTRGV